jgi:hypothetical protein
MQVVRSCEEDSRAKGIARSILSAAEVTTFATYMRDPAISMEPSSFFDNEKFSTDNAPNTELGN